MRVPVGVSDNFVVCDDGAVFSYLPNSASWTALAPIPGSAVDVENKKTAYYEKLEQRFKEPTFTCILDGLWAEHPNHLFQAITELKQLLEQQPEEAYAWRRSLQFALERLEEEGWPEHLPREVAT